MTITEYIDLVTTTNIDAYCEEEIHINDDFDSTALIKLCTKDIPRRRLVLAWNMIISAVAEKFKNFQSVGFFPEAVLDFLIENEIALCGLSHIRLPKNYLIKIYEKDNRCWEALKNM